jgi:hypothetical protein
MVEIRTATDTWPPISHRRIFDLKLARAPRPAPPKEVVSEQLVDAERSPRLRAPANRRTVTDKTSTFSPH